MSENNKKGTYYITTAIAYASGKPHIGNTYEMILADAIVQLRKWITETHIAFRLLPEKFTLRELQQIHETVLDTKLLVPAFRRKVADRVEDTGEMTGDAGHRPAKLYREKR